MPHEQLDMQRLTGASAARALKENFGFLGLFVHPRSPSEVAGKAGMPPNLAHHHARKLADLGLLFQQRREGRRVYYQLAAREFRVPWAVVPPVDETAGELGNIGRLSAAFREAYEKSWLAAGETAEYVAGFSDVDTPSLPPEEVLDPPAQPMPTHFDALTLRLPPERYRQLARDLSRLLDEAMQEGLKEQGHVCTLAVLAFEGSAEQASEAQGQGRVSRQVSSFLGAKGEAQGAGAPAP